MPALRAHDFEKLATRVVDRFLSGGAKLAEAAAEEAAAANLNPDQIQRLVQSANTMTFLRMMDQRKAEGASDLMHEFEPIDADQVVRSVIDGGGAQMLPQQPMDDPMQAVAPPDAGELPDEMSALRMNPAEGAPGHMDAPGVEACEEDCHNEGDPPGVETARKGPPKPKAKDAKKEKAKAKEKDDTDDDAPPPKSAHVMQARAYKLAAILEDQRQQAEWAFDETFDKLAARFKRLYGPSYDAFEKDAMAEHGDDIGRGVINMLRHDRRLPPLATEAFEKSAAVADHHVSEETPELHLLETLVKIATEARRLETGIAYVRSRCAA